MDEAVDGLTGLRQFAGNFNDFSNNIAGPLVSAILIVGLVFVIWSVASKQENRKTYVIAWLIALFFALMFVVNQ